MPPRFHAPDLTPEASDVMLPPGESAHLTRVLRLRPGSAVEVFDGRGLLRAGVVAQATATRSLVTLAGRIEAAPEPAARITIVQAVLKGDAMDTVIRDATVLGATVIHPVTSARTNVRARAVQGSARERWERVAVAAAKQCGRATLPEITSVRPLAATLHASGHDASGCAGAVRLWLTEPGLTAQGSADVPMPPDAVCLAIGPEGGWAPGELDAARGAGWHAWSLGPVTIRAEHVALAALSVIRYAWDVDRRRIT